MKTRTEPVAPFRLRRERAATEPEPAPAPLPPTKVFWLDRPWPRVARAILELGGVGVALWALIATIDQNRTALAALQDQQRLSAYQLIGSDNASPAVRWRAAVAILALDGEVLGFNNGCGSEATAFGHIESSTTCMYHPDFVLKGPGNGLFDAPWTFTTPVANHEFMTGHLSGVAFKGGQMTNLTLGMARLGLVTFQNIDLRRLILRYDHVVADDPAAAIGAPIEIENALLTDADITYNSIDDISVSGSDISNLTLQPPFPFTKEVIPVWDGNYYVRGEPPFVFHEARPLLADFVCAQPLNLADDPETHPACKPINGGWAVPFDHLLRRMME